MIPNIADYTEYEGGFIDPTDRTYSKMSVITPTKTYLVFNGSTLTYNGVEYNVYGSYHTKLKGTLDFTVHTK